MPTPTILDAMNDEKLFGRFFRGKSWEPWKAMLAGLFGLPMTAEQVAIYRKHTGREAVPTEQFSEAWLVCGRRSGKSRISAFVAVFLACFCNWRPYLSIGETATVMLLAGDKKQASVLMDYVAGFLTSIPILAKMIANRTQDTITLDNGVEIAIHTSSFRSVRGYSIPVVLCDEIGFWQDSDSSNPASAILQALRPAQAQFPNSLLLCFSSPYARRGVLYETYRDHFGQSDSPVLVIQAASRAMNPTISALTVLRAELRDAASAKNEWHAQFRDDLETMFTREVLEALVVLGRKELPPMAGTSYVGFVDPSGGSSDSMTLAIAHREGEEGVLDLVREVRAPFSPEAVTDEFTMDLKRYRISTVVGDAYAGHWPRDRFEKQGIRYQVSERNRSELYLGFLPRVTSHSVVLVEDQRLIEQLCRLERRRGRLGKDTVDHPSGQHDDVANAVAGAIVEAMPHELQLTYVDMVLELVRKYGAAWRDFIGKDQPSVSEPKVELPVLPAGVPANGREVFSENASVTRAQAAQKPAVSCPQCGGSCVVRRGPLNHCNACAHEWAVPGAVDPLIEQRREVLANMPLQRAPRDFRGVR